MRFRPRVFNWFHRACQVREMDVLRELDQRDSTVFRLQRRLAELEQMNEALTQTVLMSRKQNTDSLYETLFVEREVSEDRKEFLTPVWAEREGEAS